MPVLGVNVGGTKTVCVLADKATRTQSLKGAKRARIYRMPEKPANQKSIFGDGARRSRRGNTLPRFALGGIVGGVGPTRMRAVSHIGYKARILVVNDALIALVHDSPGIVIVWLRVDGDTASNADGEAARGRMGLRARRRRQRILDWAARLRAVVRHADRRAREPDAALVESLRRRKRRRGCILTRCTARN